MDRAFLALVHLRLKELEKALLVQVMSLASGIPDAAKIEVAHRRKALDEALRAWQTYTTGARDADGERHQLGRDGRGALATGQQEAQGHQHQPGIPRGGKAGSGAGDHRRAGGE